MRRCLLRTQALQTSMTTSAAAALTSCCKGRCCCHRLLLLPAPNLRTYLSPYKGQQFANGLRISNTGCQQHKQELQRAASAAPLPTCWVWQACEQLMLLLLQHQHHISWLQSWLGAASLPLQDNFLVVAHAWLNGHLKGLLLTHQAVATAAGAAVACSRQQQWISRRVLHHSVLPKPCLMYIQCSPPTYSCGAAVRIYIRAATWLCNFTHTGCLTHCAKGTGQHCQQHLETSHTVSQMPSRSVSTHNSFPCVDIPFWSCYLSGQV